MLYAATNYALVCWARRMSADWGTHRERLNAVAPGNVRTAMTDKRTPVHMVAVEAMPVFIDYETD